MIRVRFVCLLCLLVITQVGFSQIKVEGTWLYKSNDQYKPINGFLWLNDGRYFAGELSFTTSVRLVTPKSEPNQTNKPKPYKVYSITAYLIEGNNFKPEEVFMYGTTDERTAKDFMRFDDGKYVPSKKATENFQEGYIINGSGQKFEGYVAVRKELNGLSHVIYAKTLKSRAFVFYQSPNVVHHSHNLRNIVQIIDGKEVQHFPLANSFGSGEKFKGKSGYLIDAEGDRRKGIIALSNKGWLKEYGMNAYGVVLFKEDGKGDFIRAYNNFGGYQLEELVINGKKGDETYMPFDGSYFIKDKLIQKVVKTKYKEEKRNFHPGYVVFQDNSKKEGKVALTKLNDRGFYLMDAGGDLKAYSANKNIWYFGQIIDGVETKYYRVKDRFAKWEQAEKYISYIRNPYPTHIKKGLTKFVGGLVEVVSDAAIETATRAAVRENIKDGDWDEAMNNAESAQELEAAVGYSADNGQGIKFDEYIILRGGKYYGIVYKENMDAYIGDIVLDCDNFTLIDKSELKKMGNIGNLDDTIEYLNKHECWE